MTTLFDIGFETGDFSECTGSATNGGNLSVATAAALNGTYGCSALINSGTVERFWKNITKTTTHRYRLYFDPNTLTMATGDKFLFFNIFQNGGSFLVLSRFNLVKSASSYRINTEQRSDAGYVAEYEVDITDAPHYVEIKHVQAATSVSADGTFEWFLDGVSQNAITGIDNYNMMFDQNWQAEGGMLSGRDAGTSGTIYLDAYKANDDGSLIGAVSSGAVVPVFINQYRQRHT